MTDRIATAIMTLIAMQSICLVAGCRSASTADLLRRAIDFDRALATCQQPARPKPPELPANPDCGPDLPGSISQQWSLSRKTYDQTWRIRWPSHLASQGIGPGSYCSVGGHRASFRSFDTDHGARRPSYTMPLGIQLSAPVRCILYTRDGTPVAWFDAAPNTSGRLP